MRGILFNVNGSIDLLLPKRRLVIAVDDFELDVDVGMEGRAAPVGGPHLDAVPGSLGPDKGGKNHHFEKSGRERETRTGNKKVKLAAQVGAEEESFGRTRVRVPPCRW